MTKMTMEFVTLTRLLDVKIESACNYDPNATDDCLTIADIDGFFYVGQLNGSIYYFSNDTDNWDGCTK